MQSAIMLTIERISDFDIPFENTRTFSSSRIIRPSHSSFSGASMFAITWRVRRGSSKLVAPRRKEIILVMSSAEDLLAM